MDTLKTIWEDFSDRFKSPFVISFLLSWFVWNWLLVYSVFNFDASWSMFAKQSYIEQYINNNKWSNLFILPLCSSFIAAFFFYLFKAAFLALDSFYENRLRVLVVKMIGVPDMIPRTDLERYSNEISLLNKELSEKKMLFESSQTELQRLHDENERYADYNIIKSEKERLENASLSFKQDIKSLEVIFHGNWVCEFQFKPKNSHVVNRGVEKFVLVGERYYIGSEIEFIVSNIIRYENNVVEFEKRRFSNKNDVIITRVLNVYQNYWIGFELSNDHDYSFVRYYPESLKPNHLLVFTKESDISGLVEKFPLLHDFASKFKFLK